MLCYAMLCYAMLCDVTVRLFFRAFVMRLFEVNYRDVMRQRSEEEEEEKKLRQRNEQIRIEPSLRIT